MPPTKKSSLKNHPRNYVFIDSQNLYMGIKAQGWELDYAKFFKFLKDRYHIDKAFYFIGYVPKYKKLYNFLERTGYKMMFKQTSRNYKGKLQGNVDTDMVLHAMIEFDNYDKAIIISADGDFYSLIKYLKEQDKLLKVGLPSFKNYSKLLKEFKKDFLFISDHRDRLDRKRNEKKK